MTKLERPSMRRISTLDSIEEASSDSSGSHCRLSVGGIGGGNGRLSLGFSVNIPAHQRPQRKETGNVAAPQLGSSMARRRSSRFRTSLCAVADSRPSPPQPPRRRTSTFSRRMSNELTHKLNNEMANEYNSGAASAFIGGSSSVSTRTTTAKKPKKPLKAANCALEPMESYIPSYARPTAASLAKAKRKCQ